MPPAKSKNKPRASTKKEVNRDLSLVSPLLKGPDVKALQQSLNHLCDHYEFDWHHIAEDGEYGRRTARQAAFVGFMIGLDEDRLHAVKAGRIAEDVQVLFRNPEKRSKQDKGREERRKPKLKKLRKQHQEGMQAAVEWAVKHKGVHEEPADSNRGPFPIDECQAYFGLSGQPWCGCFVGYAIEKIGGIDTGTWWPYAGSIHQDALAGRNGLEDINPAQADVGCVATFFNGGDDHVALIRAKSKGSTLFTVEGNTSSASQDSDGGIIETKERSFSEATCVARLTIQP